MYYGSTFFKPDKLLGLVYLPRSGLLEHLTAAQRKKTAQAEFNVLLKISIDLLYMTMVYIIYG